jgi:hypothetical protein
LKDIITDKINTSLITETMYLANEGDQS